MIDVLVLIPAYEPDLRLVGLIQALRTPTVRVLVVDDGSGDAYDGVFAVAAEAGADVVRTPRNRGKGAALKTGFAWASEHAPGEIIVCADCDGQHTPTDILRVAEAVRPDTMVLGGRRFTGRVPLRSRFGNAVTRWVFRAVTGRRTFDTQTGLRGYPADLVPWLLAVDGDRFEYEANLLLQARAARVEVVEIPIETIYLDENASSHFRPIADSARIYAPVIRFALSGLAGAAIDWVGVLSLMALTGNLLVSVVSARVVSALVNFRLNRTLVFGDTGDARTALKRYAALAVAILVANYALLATLVDMLGVPLVLAKLVVETGLFIVSYVVQHRGVFTTPASAQRQMMSRPSESSTSYRNGTPVAVAKEWVAK